MHNFTIFFFFCLISLFKKITIIFGQSWYQSHVSWLYYLFSIICLKVNFIFYPKLLKNVPLLYGRLNISYFFLFKLFIMCLSILCYDLHFGLTELDWPSLLVHSNEYISIDRRFFYYNEVNQKVHFLLMLFNAGIDLFA